MTSTPYFYRKDGNLQRILVDEIIFLDVTGNYVKLHSMRQPYLIRSTFDAVLSQLPEHLFVQIHRSVAVAIEYIDNLSRDSLTLVGVPDVELPVSKKYYNKIIERIKIIEAGRRRD
jgi:DNA-binding LytR/AlgR family response regulator